MDSTTPSSQTQSALSALAMELETLRDILASLSLQLADFQFDSDSVLRASAVSQTDQLLQACRYRAE